MVVCAGALAALLFPHHGLVAAASRASSDRAEDRTVLEAYEHHRYDEVARLLERRTPEPGWSPRALKAGVSSYLKLGKPESALSTYKRMTASGSPDDYPLLREAALALVTSFTRDPLEHLRIAAYTELADIETPDVVALLDDGLLDSSLVVRARAGEGLSRLGGAGAATNIRRTLQDTSLAVRIATLNAIGNSKKSALLKLVTPIARSAEGPEQVFALAAMVSLGKVEVLDELLGLATLPDPDTRMAALGALGRLKRPATLPHLSQSVYDPDPAVRAFAAGALGEFGSPDVVPSLTHALGDDHPRVRSVAATSLGQLRLPQLRAYLWQATRDPVEFVRIGGVEGLLRLGDAEALLVATDLAKHPDPSVRSALAHALGVAGYRKASPLLDQLLRDQQPQPRLAAARALGKLGERDVVPILKKGLEDSDQAVRIAAAGSLVKAVTAAKKERREPQAPSSPQRSN